MVTNRNNFMEEINIIDNDSLWGLFTVCFMVHEIGWLFWMPQQGIQFPINHQTMLTTELNNYLDQI